MVRYYIVMKLKKCSQSRRNIDCDKGLESIVQRNLEKVMYIK
jgi:hypothetical protein